MFNNGIIIYKEGVVKSMKCPHCETALNKLSERIFFCSFCDMEVMFEMGNRPYGLKGAVDHVDARKSTKELKLYHTFDLLLLLRFCREERRTAYELMQVVNRVKALNKSFSEGFKEAYSQYDYWTKKCRIAESLVKERIGTIPKAVTSQLLDTFFNSFQEAAAPLKKYA